MQIRINACLDGGMKANPAYIRSVVKTAIIMAKMNNVFFFMFVNLIISPSKPNRQNSGEE